MHFPRPASSGRASTRSFLTPSTADSSCFAAGSPSTSAPQADLARHSHRGAGLCGPRPRVRTARPPRALRRPGLVPVFCLGRRCAACLPLPPPRLHRRPAALARRLWPDLAPRQAARRRRDLSFPSSRASRSSSGPSPSTPVPIWSSSSPRSWSATSSSCVASRCVALPPWHSSSPFISCCPSSFLRARSIRPPRWAHCCFWSMHPPPEQRHSPLSTSSGRSLPPRCWVAAVFGGAPSGVYGPRSSLLAASPPACTPSSMCSPESSPSSSSCGCLKSGPPSLPARNGSQTPGASGASAR